MRFAVLAVLVGCGRLGFDAVPGPGDAPVEVTVGPQATTIGKTWLLPAASGTDTPCANDEQWYSACDHPAEHMVVRVADESTECATLTVGDELGAFDWRCTRSGSELVFESLGLKRDTGLRNLVDEAGWRPNRFLAKEGSVERFASDPAVWWDNPVVALPDNASTGTAVTLADTRTIYVLGSSRATAGYVIGADHIGVVILDGAALSWGGGANNCGRTPDNIDSQCLVSANQRRTGVWIEGTLDGRGMFSSAQSGVQLYDPYWLQLRGVHTHHFSGDGIALDYGVSLLHEVSSTSNSGSGFDGYATGVTARHIVTANNTNHGFSSRSFGMHMLADVRTYGNQTNGINFVADATGMFADVIAAHNGNTGVYCANAYTGGAWHGVTAIGNGLHGVEIEDLNGGTLNRIVAVNNGGDGIFLNTMQVSEVSQLVSAHNSGAGLHADTLDDGLFINNLLISNNVGGNCSVTGTNNNAGIDNACASAGTFTTGFNLTSTFIGTSQSLSYSSIDEWDLAEHEWVYGPGGSGALSMGSRGRCVSGTCALWDYGITATDTVLRGRLYTPGQVCPAAVEGGEELSAVQEQCFSLFGYPQVRCPRVSLINAMEVLDDHVGNDDGFCESNERCEYLPHLSNARGRGGPLDPCIFDEGTANGDSVVGVTIVGRAD